MNSHSLFRRSRLRLALWYAGVMGVILSILGLGVYRSLLQSNWAAMNRELESIAGTLHDSLEPILPVSGDATVVLQRILPELCLAGQPCNPNPTLIQRHTTGISDRSTYYIRLFNHQGRLLAFSPNQSASFPQAFDPSPWQTVQTSDGIRYRQFTIILHSANAHPTDLSHTHSWGYLQLGRTLERFDGETRRIQLILVIGCPISLFGIALSSWWLSGLAMQPIHQSYQQQQQFTANAAHELRSPLASLLATVEAMLRLSSSQQQDMPAMLEAIERQGRRLSDLIADLLFLTRLEHSSSAQPFQPCCLNDVVNDLTEEFLERATMEEVHLTNQVPDQEIYVLGNESQLYRLVSNLIANGIQYTHKGGRVEVTLTQHEHFVNVAIKDTGIGIAAQEQTRIFERFYRVDNNRSRQTGGTGLGLAIAQAIAQAHQARIFVQSTVGMGTIFTVHFPIYQV